MNSLQTSSPNNSRSLRRARAPRRAPAHGLALLLVAVALIACGPAPTPVPPAATPNPPAAGNPLASTEWQLVSLHGEPLLEGTHISLEFEEDRLGGFAGCNHYGGGPDSGGYDVTPEGGFEIPMLAITEMACLEPEGVMEQEQAYVQALTGATVYRLEDDTLSLQNAGGETVLVFRRVPTHAMDPADLIGTAWRLVSLDGQPPQQGDRLTLAFHDEGRAGGYAGCRAFVAGYQAEGDEMDVFSTAMMDALCPEVDGGQQAAEYTTVLGWANRFLLEGERLELRTSRGEVLTYEALPPAAQPDLEGPTWSLLGFVQPNPAEGLPAPMPLPTETLPGTEITIAFAQGQVTGTASCNQYGGSYRLEGSALAIADLFQTEIACLEPVGVMDQEQRYLQALRQATAAHVYGSQLWIETAGGEALAFGLP